MSCSSALLSTASLILVCLNIGLTIGDGAWNKIPYAVSYGRRPNKLVPVPVASPPAHALPNQNPSALSSRSGFAAGAGESGYGGEGPVSIGMIGGGFGPHNFAPVRRGGRGKNGWGDSHGLDNGHVQYHHGHNWGPSPLKKHIQRPSQYLQQAGAHEKTPYLQKLIPMFAIGGKLSDILTWFSDPHGHRYGFSQPPAEHGWDK